jgi:hypothetical protein
MGDFGRYHVHIDAKRSRSWPSLHAKRQDPAKELRVKLDEVHLAFNTGKEEAVPSQGV